MVLTRATTLAQRLLRPPRNNLSTMERPRSPTKRLSRTRRTARGNRANRSAYCNATRTIRNSTTSTRTRLSIISTTTANPRPRIPRIASARTRSRSRTTVVCKVVSPHTTSGGLKMGVFSRPGSRLGSRPGASSPIEGQCRSWTRCKHRRPRAELPCKHRRPRAAWRICPTRTRT